MIHDWLSRAARGLLPFAYPFYFLSYSRITSVSARRLNRAAGLDGFRFSFARPRRQRPPATA